MSAALYAGTVRHRRLRADAPADFTHPLTLVYAELESLPHVLGGRLTRRSPGLVRIRPRDLHGRARDFAATAARVRATVAEQSGRPAPHGAIAVLTHPRVAGVCFNPVSFYYLSDAAGELDAVLAEVTSTPWRERRAYVLRKPAGDDGHAEREPGRRRRTSTPGLTGEHAKTMRVSPFQPMAQRYAWTVSEPGARLRVSIVNYATANGEPELAAALNLSRQPLTPSTLRTFLRRHPAGTLRILALIYGHAIALKLRGAQVHGRTEVAA